MLLCEYKHIVGGDTRMKRNNCKSIKTLPFHVRNYRYQQKVNPDRMASLIGVYRDGKYFAVEGAHILMVLKTVNKGKQSFPVKSVLS